MKRKGERSIPDFSGKKKGTPPVELDRVKDRSPVAREPAVKPQSTSAKSGRRGQ